MSNVAATMASAPESRLNALGSAGVSGNDKIATKFSWKSAQGQQDTAFDRRKHLMY
jgi:hypothetical protein